MSITQRIDSVNLREADMNLEELALYAFRKTGIIQDSEGLTALYGRVVAITAVTFKLDWSVEKEVFFICTLLGPFVYKPEKTGDRPVLRIHFKSDWKQLDDDIRVDFPMDTDVHALPKKYPPDYFLGRPYVEYRGQYYYITECRSC